MVARPRVTPLPLMVTDDTVADVTEKADAGGCDCASSVALNVSVTVLPLATADCRTGGVRFVTVRGPNDAVARFERSRRPPLAGIVYDTCTVSAAVAACPNVSVACAPLIDTPETVRDAPPTMTENDVAATVAVASSV